jgi:esterase/lipase
MERYEDKLIPTKGGTLLVSGGDTPEGANPQWNTCVLFVPGMSGKAHSERFEPLVEVCLSAGYPIARLEAWKDPADANTETYAYWQSVVSGAVTTLLEKEFESVIAIGKSFGGGLLLSQPLPGVTKKILWAPAIGFSKTEETLSELREQPPGGYKLLDIKLTPTLLVQETANIAIVHGDADEVVSATNSRQIVSAVTSGAIAVVSGAGHSFNAPEHERALLEQTSRFLKG